MTPNARHAVRYHHARKPATIIERIPPNARHSVWYRHARKPAAIIECTIPNTCNGLTSECTWNHQRTCWTGRDGCRPIAFVNLRTVTKNLIIPRVVSDLFRISHKRQYSGKYQCKKRQQFSHHSVLFFCPPFPLWHMPLQGAEKKSGVPYFLTSHVGIAKRPKQNMMRRHATWIVHVAQPSYSALFLEIGDFT